MSATLKSVSDNVASVSEFGDKAMAKRECFVRGLNTGGIISIG